MNKPSEQKLVDITFRVAMTIYQNPNNMFDLMDREEIMKWVALQLECEGYSTTPMGMSWGVLKK